MKIESQPLVTVLTPVYNGEKYLAECIESILAQKYNNWELIIVNNCSTDRTSEIAQAYAAIDPRIHIHHNSKFVDVIENHNIAFAKIPNESSYCKLVQADDWLFPECLLRMVEVAESQPSVGVVGAYSLAGTQVRCNGLPYPSYRVSGHEISRLTLLGLIYLFWSPSSILLRSNIIRKQLPFYNNKYKLYADLDAMYRVLQYYDFGFVHQVLSYIRIHSESITIQDSKKIGSQKLSHLSLLINYGSVFLDEEEFHQQRVKVLQKYYVWLAQCFFEIKEWNFWKQQQLSLQQLDYSLDFIKLIVAIFSNLIFTPKDTARRLKKAFLSKFMINTEG